MATRKTNVSPRLMTFFKVNSEVSAKLRSGTPSTKKEPPQSAPKAIQITPPAEAKMVTQAPSEAINDAESQAKTDTPQPAVLILPCGKLTPVRFSSPIGYTILVTQPNCPHDSKNILHKMSFEDAEQRGFPVYSLHAESFDLYPVNRTVITQCCDECALNTDKLTTPARKAIVLLDFTALDTITIDDCNITVRKPDGFISQQGDIVAVNTASPEFRDAIFDVNLFLTNLFDKTLCANFAYLIVSSEFKAMMTSVKYRYYEILKVFDPVITLDSIVIEDSPLEEEMDELDYANEVIEFKPKPIETQDELESLSDNPPQPNDHDELPDEIFIPTKAHARFVKHIKFNSAWTERTLLVCLFEAGLKHWLPMLEKHKNLVIGEDRASAHRLVCDTYEKWIDREAVTADMVRDAFMEACYNVVDTINLEFSFSVLDSLAILMRRAD